MGAKLPPLILGKYEVVDRLAIGGMGEIFHAMQRRGPPDFERPVILKNLLPDLAAEQTFVDQFFDEARVVGQLDHPNVVSVYDYGEWQGQYFIAMEFIKGCNASQLIKAAVQKHRRIPWRVIAKIILDVAQGLEHAHRAVDASGKPLGIVHRDVSPQNIMVRQDGVAKIVDFGIARADNRASRTASGAVKGKLAYMAPEQVELGSVTALADQFSLGVVFWELATQSRLFHASDDTALLEVVKRCEVPRVRTLVSDAPPELAEVIDRMLQRDPARRFPSTGDVARALQLYFNRPSLGSGRFANAVPPQTAVAEFIREVGVADASLKPSGVARPSTPGPSPTAVVRPGLHPRLRVGLLGGGAVLLGALAAVAVLAWPRPPPPAPVVVPPPPPPDERGLREEPGAAAAPATAAVVTVTCAGSTGTGFFVGPSRVVTTAAFDCAPVRVRLADDRTLLGSVARRLPEVRLLELDIAAGDGAPLDEGDAASLAAGQAVRVPGAASGALVAPLQSCFGVPCHRVELDLEAPPGAPLLDERGRVAGVMVDGRHAVPIEALGSRWAALVEASAPAVDAEVTAVETALASPVLISALKEPSGAVHAVLLSRSPVLRLSFVRGACRLDARPVWAPYRATTWADARTEAAMRFLEKRQLTRQLLLSIVELPKGGCDGAELVLESAPEPLRAAPVTPVAARPAQ